MLEISRGSCAGLRVAGRPHRRNFQRLRGAGATVGSDLPGSLFHLSFSHRLLCLRCVRTRPPFSFKPFWFLRRTRRLISTATFLARRSFPMTAHGLFSQLAWEKNQVLYTFKRWTIRSPQNLTALRMLPFHSGRLT